MIRLLAPLALAVSLSGCGAIHEGLWAAACSSPLHLDRRAGMSLDDCVQKNARLHIVAMQQFAGEVVNEFGVRYYYCGPSLCQHPTAIVPRTWRDIR